MYENLAATLHTFLSALSLNIKEKYHWQIVTEIVCTPAQYFFRWNFAVLGHWVVASLINIPFTCVCVRQTQHRHYLRSMVDRD